MILCATDAWFILCTNKIYTYDYWSVSSPSSGQGFVQVSLFFPGVSIILLYYKETYFSYSSRDLFFHFPSGLCIPQPLIYQFWDTAWNRGKPVGELVNEKVRSYYATPQTSARLRVHEYYGDRANRYTYIFPLGFSRSNNWFTPNSRGVCFSVVGKRI